MWRQRSARSDRRTESALSIFAASGRTRRSAACRLSSRDALRIIRKTTDMGDCVAPQNRESWQRGTPENSGMGARNRNRGGPNREDPPRKSPVHAPPGAGADACRARGPTRDRAAGVVRSLAAALLSPRRGEPRPLGPGETIVHASRRLVCTKCGLIGGYAQPSGLAEKGQRRRQDKRAVAHGVRLGRHRDRKLRLHRGLTARRALDVAERATVLRNLKQRCRWGGRGAGHRVP